MSISYWNETGYGAPWNGVEVVATVRIRLLNNKSYTLFNPHELGYEYDQITTSYSNKIIMILSIGWYIITVPFTSWPIPFSIFIVVTCLQEDLDIMKNLNFDAYRFSISWSRIFPGMYNLCQWPSVNIIGRCHFWMKLWCFVWTLGFHAEGTGKVNWEGVAYYNRLINYMLKKGSHNNGNKGRVSCFPH